MIELGRIEAIFRYPVKSIRGEAVDAVVLGLHGLEGDRRLAFRRIDDRSGFPWLTAGKLPDLIRFTPVRRPEGKDDGSPTHVLTPEGVEMPIFGELLAGEVSRRCGVPVEMAYLKHGIFDDGSVSAIASETVSEVCGLAGQGSDARRFRPNIVVRSARAVPFEEDGWMGGVLTFGGSGEAPAIAVTALDVRCAMVNIDPDGGPGSPEVLKAVVRANGNNAGIYGTVTRVGRLAVGQAIFLHSPLGTGR